MSVSIDRWMYNKVVYLSSQLAGFDCSVYVLLYEEGCVFDLKDEKYSISQSYNNTVFPLRILLKQAATFTSQGTSEGLAPSARYASRPYN